jgi:hypothetical protein
MQNTKGRCAADAASSGSGPAYCVESAFTPAAVTSLMAVTNLRTYNNGKQLACTADDLSTMVRMVTL